MTVRDYVKIPKRENIYAKLIHLTVTNLKKWYFGVNTELLASDIYIPKEYCILAYNVHNYLW